jgi:hypothetical protein
MNYEFEPHAPAHRFVATRAGAGLDPDIRCEHGHPAVSLYLMTDASTPPRPPLLAGDLQVLMPSCMAPQLFGAVLAFIRAERGTDAAEEFMQQMHAASDRAARSIADSVAQHRACCEAGSRTGGREHTCGGHGGQT